MVTVKAYPAISQKYGEVVCVAGIRTDTPVPAWVRLFPVPFRDIPFAQRFKKYQHISLEAERHSGDKRPETFRPNVDTLELGDVVLPKKTWLERKRFVEPLLVDSMCDVLQKQQSDGTSLAAIRPGEVIDLVVDDDVQEWNSSKTGVAAQPTLFFQGKHGLEQIPYRWRGACAGAAAKNARTRARGNQGRADRVPSQSREKRGARLAVCKSGIC